MSRSATYRYRLSAEQEHRLYLERSRETARRRYESLSVLYDEMIRQDLMQVIPKELEGTRQDLALMLQLLEHDPERAEAIGARLSEDVTKLTSLARATRREFEQRHRERMAQLFREKTDAETQLLAYLNEQLQSIVDPVTRDFAFEGISALRRELVDRTFPREQISSLKETVRSRVELIRVEAEQSASGWKAQKEAELRAEAQEAFLEIRRKEMAEDLQGNPDLLKKVLDKLNAAKDCLKKGIAVDEEKIAETIQQVEAAVMEERYRKETVRAVMRSLRESGFILAGTPRCLRNESQDEVVIIGRKPAGNQAEFRVKLEGDLSFCFDGYEGAMCRKDISKVIPKLQDIYGVRLSDERVVWENPERISMSSRPIQVDQDGHNHGH
jgi:hypothetical protein